MGGNTYINLIYTVFCFESTGLKVGHFKHIRDKLEVRALSRQPVADPHTIH